MEAAGWREVARQLGAAGAPQPDGSLSTRRATAFGPAVDPLFYDEPIQVAGAEGVWITDADGPALSRRLQQRPVRRARPSARHGGDRAPEPQAQHAHALPAPRRHRARRAAGRELPAGARHGAARQLRLGGQRSGLADGDRGHRPPRRPVHRLRLSRHHRGDRGAVPGGLVRRADAGPRRDVGAARHLPRAASSTPTRSPARWPDAPIAVCRRRPPSSTASSPATASPTSIRLRPGARAPDPRRRRPVDRRRGPGRPRPHRRRHVVVSSASGSSPTSSRWASRWATGTRSPPSSPAGTSSPPRRPRHAVQHLRRQPGERRGGARRARRHRRRARARTRAADRSRPARGADGRPATTRRSGTCAASAWPSGSNSSPTPRPAATARAHGRSVTGCATSASWSASPAPAATCSRSGRRWP